MHAFALTQLKGDIFDVACQAAEAVSETIAMSPQFPFL